MTLTQILLAHTKAHTAVGHFNISNLEMLRAILEAAKEMNQPIMIGTSEGEAEYLGRKEIVALMEAYRADWGVEALLNADHHKSVEAAKAAIEAGYQSIHIDLSKLPFEENVAGTHAVVEYAHAKDIHISVEGELGVLATDSSKVYAGEIVVRPEDLTSPEQAAEFVERTGVNRFAPAVGNFHGMATHTKKQLDFGRIEAIRKILPEEVAIVLHGGSGTSDDQLQEAIKRGVANIHISTELRVAYSSALRKFLTDHLEETTPYKMFPSVIEAVHTVVSERMRLFTDTN
jgi:ketose-bisphosphate aldolase